MAAGGVAGAGFDPMGDLGRPESSSTFAADGFFSAFEDVRIPAREPGPGDSNYELTFTLRDSEGDSSSEWDATTDEVEPEAPSSDEIRAAGAVAAEAPESWHHRFVQSWALALIVAALALIALSVAAIIYLLCRMAVPGPPIELPTPALIAGFACTVGLLMISVPLVLLAASVSELVRDFRRLNPRVEPRGLVARR